MKILLNELKLCFLRSQFNIQSTSHIVNFLGPKELVHNMWFICKPQFKWEITLKKEFINKTKSKTSNSHPERCSYNGNQIISSEASLLFWTLELTLYPKKHRTSFWKRGAAPPLATDLSSQYAYNYRYKYIIGIRDFNLGI